MKRLLSAFIALCALAAPAQAQDYENFSIWGEGESIFGKDPVPPGMDLVQLATLTSDRDQNKNYLNLMVDAKGAVTGMYNKADPNNKEKGESNGKNVYWLRDIESSAGAVMLTAKGRDVLIMQGRLEPVSQEGRFQLKYLANGLFMRYEICEFNLRRDGDGWMVENAYNKRRVTSIKVLTHSLGITTVQGICPER